MDRNGARTFAFADQSMGRLRKQCGSTNGGNTRQKTPACEAIVTHSSLLCFSR
jgi:hypothetical protein